MSLEITAFFHGPSSTYSYVVAEGGHAAVIDPVLDYDAASGRSGAASVQKIVEHLKARGHALDWILETHAHADHLSAAQFVKRELGGNIAIGSGITAVQASFRKLYNLGKGFPADGSQFDKLWEDGESFRLGEVTVRVMTTPGHTSDSVAYIVEDAVFVGDTLFMPDSGSARCDFPGGDAGALYDSIRRLLDLPEETRLFMCHDYAPGGREHRNQTTVGEERRANVHVKDGVSREDFVKLRQDRDATLPVPALLLPAIQVNIRAGNFPEPEQDGSSYLKIPVNKL